MTSPAPNRRAHWWWILALLPVIGLAAIILLIATERPPDPQRTPTAPRYPTPAPVVFVSPTPRPTQPEPTHSPDEHAVIGELAPDIPLRLLDNRPFLLHDLAGKIVFLNFWATWCDPCRDEMPALQALQDERGADVRVIAVTDPNAGQTEQAVRDFVDEFGLTLLVVASSDPALYQYFEVVQIPVTFIIDRRGIVRFEHIGPLDADDIAGYLEQLDAE